MKAIRTKFLAATNTMPSRICADDGDGNSIIISADCSDPHQQAACSLANKMGWVGQLIEGIIGNEHVFVWSIKDGSSHFQVGN